MQHRASLCVVLTSLLGAGLLGAGLLGCNNSDPDHTDEAPPPPPLCERVDSLDALPEPGANEYDYQCSGDVPPGGQSLPGEPLPHDCTSGIWPDLDDTVDVCPTLSDSTVQDPGSGKTLPSTDGRQLPLDIAVSETGSFLASSQEDYADTLRVVAWNVEYTRDLDAQLQALTSHPKLSTADVYLLSEVDRCSTRNGTRRAARILAEALQADYAYGIEFVELNIGRDIGGDTGQAILARRPLTGAALTCHSSQYDWLDNEDEPRLGQRVFLHGDIPVGNVFARIYAAHLESNDIFGNKRSVQAKEILDQAQALACRRPQIIAGDFNSPYCGAPELDVMRTSGFVDALALVGDVEPTHKNGFRLDYIWVDGFSVLGGGVVRNLEASDHDALWVDLQLN